MPNVIWESVADERYRCWVEREDVYTGILRVRDQVTQDLLLERQVDLSYGALFGPDVNDVDVWLDLCVKAIDQVP